MYENYYTAKPKISKTLIVQNKKALIQLYNKDKTMQKIFMHAEN